MWQFIVIIKFEKAYLKKPEVFNALMRFIADSLQGQSDNVNVTICIYTDAEPTTFLENPTQELPQINVEAKYILFLNTTDAGKVDLGEQQINDATLSGTKIPVSFSLNQPVKDLLRPQELSELFKKVKPENSKDKTLLFLLDHGSGFAIFGEPDITPTSLPGNASISVPFIDTQIRNLKYYDLAENDENFKERSLTADEIDDRNKFNKSLSSNSESTDPVIFFEDDVVEPLNLTMDELAQALDKAEFNPNVLVLANCLMLTIDTLYALRNSAKYLVATSTGFSYELFNIKSILKELPFKKSKDAARLFIDSVKDSESTWRPIETSADKELTRESVAIFALELALFEKNDFWNNLKGCIANCIKIINTSNGPRIIENTISNIFPMNLIMGNYSLPYYLIDALGFFHYLLIYAKSDLDESDYLKNIAALKQLFTHNTNMQFSGSIASKDRYRCFSATLKLPASKLQFDCRFIRLYYNGSSIMVEKQNPYRSSFCRDFDWDYFLWTWYNKIK